MDHPVKMFYVMILKTASATKTTNMKKIFSLLLLIYSSSLVAAMEDGRNTVKANLTTVTVFRIGAEMNHLAKATLVKGNNDLIIENISNALEANSIQVNCNGNVTIMGVEFSTDHLQNEIKTPLIKMLEDSLETV